MAWASTDWVLRVHVHLPEGFPESLRCVRKQRGRADRWRASRAGSQSFGVGLNFLLWLITSLFRDAKWGQK